MPIILGCIADDFTGATDLANTLVKQGMPTIQLIGTPKSAIDLGDAEAVVIALKSRTIQTNDAIAESLEAIDWLQSQGAKQYFFKYCSTFDSTDEGNIGPVADALLDKLDSDFTIACPAFPTNGRTIYKGNLFVGDELLSESGMRNHPLTPMTDSNLVRVLARQTPRKVGLVEHGTVGQGADAISDAYKELRDDGVRHAIVDAIDDPDLLAIGTASTDLALITGGSGIALGLPDNYRAAGLLGDAIPPHLPAQSGAEAILAGSCSIRTREQVAAWKEKFPALQIDPHAVMQNKPVADEALDWATPHLGKKPFLIYSSDDPAAVTALQEQYGGMEVGEKLEDTLGQIASKLVAKGVDRLIAAGGETSGAVVNALHVDALRIGPEISPGVPWTETIGTTSIALALKSGNFGEVDFFDQALEMLR